MIIRALLYIVLYTTLVIIAVSGIILLVRRILHLKKEVVQARENLRPLPQKLFLELFSITVAISLILSSSATYLFSINGLITFDFPGVLSILPVVNNLLLLVLLYYFTHHLRSLFHLKHYEYLIPAILLLLTISGLSYWLSERNLGNFYAFEFCTLCVLIGIGTGGFYKAQREITWERFKGPTLRELKEIFRHHLFEDGYIALDNNQDLEQYNKGQVKEAALKFHLEMEKEWGLRFDRKNNTLTLERGEGIKDFGSIFHAAGRQVAETSIDQPKLDHIANLLDSAVKKHLHFQEGAPFEIDRNQLGARFRVFSYAFEALESILPAPFPCIVYVSDNSDFRVFRDTYSEVLKSINIRLRFSVLIMITPSPIDRKLVQEEFGLFENIFILDREAVFEILAAKKELKFAIMDSIQQQIDLTIFSPYKTKAPTTKDMFYGRRRELGTIVEKINDGSIAVLGARRMGKTSLLQSVQREVVKLEKKFQLYYLDCYHISNYDDFFKEINNRWPLPPKAKKVREIMDFPSLVMSIKNQYPGTSLVFQFDEIDRLLSHDASEAGKETLFRMFRSLAQEKHAQFIFSGERFILDQLSNPNSCFFNFTSEIRLGLLDYDVVKDLIEIPTELIGVALENEKVVQEIFQYTSGHPNLIQFLCELCLEELSERKQRILTEELVHLQGRGHAFKDEFKKTYWAQSSPLEKAISILVAKFEMLNRKNIFNLLQEHGFEVTLPQFERGLRYLELSQVLVENGHHYTVKPEKFTDFLLVGEFDYKAWIDSFLNEYMSKVD